jgi:hypothetical protein
MLTDAHKESRKAIVTVPNMTLEVRVSCLWLSRKQHLMEHCRTKSPLRINSWVCHHLKNCGYSLFGWGLEGPVNTSCYIETVRSRLLSLFVQQMAEVLCLSMTVEGYRHLSASEVITLWTVFLHPPNGPDLALSDCHLFGHPQKSCDSIITPFLRHCRTPCTRSSRRRAMNGGVRTCALVWRWKTLGKRGTLHWKITLRLAMSY